MTAWLGARTDISREDLDGVIVRLWENFRHEDLTLLSEAMLLTTFFIWKKAGCTKEQAMHVLEQHADKFLKEHTN